MTKLTNWQLLEKTDVSPSPFFPLEKRKYQRPDGVIVDDFYVTTLADCVHVIPITTDGRVVMIRMYKQGVDQIVTQFPAGRLESKHTDLLDVAVHELEEETGIKVDRDQLRFVAKQAVMTTKSTEMIHTFVVPNITFNSQPDFDENEEIEVITLTPSELDQMISNGEIIESQMVADWYLVKTKFPNLVNLAPSQLST